MSSEKTNPPRLREKKFTLKQKSLWKQACEAEKNFQLAVDKATGFLPIKSKEDYEFMKKWIFFSSLQK